MTRNEMIGTACAGAALIVVTNLVYDSWQIAECRELLRYSEFEALENVDPVNYPTEVSQFFERMKAGELTEAEARCERKVGLPF